MIRQLKEIYIKLIFIALNSLVVTLMTFQPASGANKVNNSLTSVDDFVGRTKEIRELSLQLKNNNYLHIAGMPGIGKSELMRKYLETNATSYDIVWWWDMDGDIDQQGIDLVHSINKQICKARCNLRIASKNILEEAHQFILKNRVKTLFVIDNADNNTWVKYFSDFFRTPNLKIVSIGIKKHNIKNEIVVSDLQEIEAQRYLKKYINLSRYEAKDLAKMLSYSPLAISTAVIFLNKHKSVSVDMYKKMHKANDVRFFDLKFNEEHPRYNKSVISALNVSKARIKEEDIKAYNLLIWSSYLYDENISDDVLKVLYLKNFQGSGLLDYVDSIGRVESYVLMKIATMQNGGSKKIKMHNSLKQIMLAEISGKENHIYNIQNILEAMLEVLPKASNPLALEDYVTKHPEILINAAEVLKLADEYDVYSIERLYLEIRLLRAFMFNLQYSQSNNIINRVSTALNKYRFNDKEQQKANVLIAIYLYLKGTYLDFAKSDYKESIKAFREAELLLQSIKGEYEVKYNILMQHAQCLIYSGRVREAEPYIDKTEMLIKKPGFPKVNLSVFYFIKAKYYLENGQYEEALKQIEYSIKTIEEGFNESKSVIFTSIPDKLLKSEILLRMGKKEEAYSIANKVHEASLGIIEKDHELYSRILLTLSSAEVANGNIKQAKIHVKKATTIIKNKYDMSENHLLRQDDDLASALIIEGDINHEEGNKSEALREYLEAKEILHTRYENIVEVDKLNELYMKIFMVALESNDKYLVDKFFELNKSHFGIKHPRTERMIGLLSGKSKI